MEREVRRGEGKRGRTDSNYGSLNFLSHRADVHFGVQRFLLDPWLLVPDAHELQDSSSADRRVTAPSPPLPLRQVLQGLKTESCICVGRSCHQFVHFPASPSLRLCAVRLWTEGEYFCFNNTRPIYLQGETLLNCIKQEDNLSTYCQLTAYIVYPYLYSIYMFIAYLLVTTQHIYIYDKSVKVFDWDRL